MPWRRASSLVTRRTEVETPPIRCGLATRYRRRIVSGRPARLQVPRRPPAACFLPAPTNPMLLAVGVPSRPVRVIAGNHLDGVCGSEQELAAKELPPGLEIDRRHASTRQLSNHAVVRH